MPRLTDFSGMPTSGQVPFCVVGIVIDNDDPKKWGRIKVKFPTLQDDPVSYWIRQSSPNAGKERGLYALPEVDDEVLVVFMQGSQDVGVIIGQFWNGVDIPPAEAIAGMPVSGDTDIGGTWSTAMHTDGSTDDADNDRRFWKSRSGHLFVFDDTSGSETVQIWNNTHTLSLVFDTAQDMIVLANTAGDIHIRCANDLYLEAGNDIKYYAGNNINGEAGTDITTKAGSNYTHESGSNVESKAGADMKLEATSNYSAKGLNATIEASAAAKVKGGGTANFEAGGSNTIKGATVMIN